MRRFRFARFVLPLGLLLVLAGCGLQQVQPKSSTGEPRLEPFRHDNAIPNGDSHSDRGRYRRKRRRYRQR